LNPAAPGDFRWRPLDALSWDEAAAAFTAGYEGYVIPVRVGGADLAARCEAEDVDRAASYVISDDAGPAAIGLIARRGSRARLAAFAVVPRMRGRGLARPALARLIEESERRGDEALELEVFEHNLPAVRLYEAGGFLPTDRLVGFEAETASPPAGQAPALETSTPAELAAQLAADAAGAGLPWQLQADTIGRMGAPWQVVRDGSGAWAMVDLSRADAVGLRLMFTLAARRRQGLARRLLAAIRANAAGKPVRVAQLIPERNAPFARALGFKEAEHGQLRMVRRRAA